MSRDPELKVYSSFIPERTRKLIIQKFIGGDSVFDLANRYDIRIRTVNEYIDRYYYTGSVLSDYELKKKYGLHHGTKTFDDPKKSNFILGNCSLDLTRSLTAYEHDMRNEFVQSLENFHRTQDVPYLWTLHLYGCTCCVLYSLTSF